MALCTKRWLVLYHTAHVVDLLPMMWCCKLRPSTALVPSAVAIAREHQNARYGSTHWPHKAHLLRKWSRCNVASHSC